MEYESVWLWLPFGDLLGVGRLTAKKVAGRKIADINAIIRIALVS